MNTNKPKISIVCPSYNHEKYVRYYIESILKQTEQDFELIIVDDFSEDNNVQEIKKFSDPRIKLIEHDYNKGLNASLNDAMNVANSDLISFIASDDILEPNYIERVLLEFEQKDISVAYVALQYINEKNSLLKGNVMLPVGLSRFQILKKSFEGENQIPSPGMVMKKSAINPFLPLPVGLLQYQDWQMHNYLLMENEISLINEKLIRYRISPDSASACSDKVVARSKMETTEMMDVFLRIKDVDLLKKIFADDLDKYGKPVNETIPYFLARLALDSPIKEKQHWGYKTILHFISKQGNLDLLKSLYGFNFKQYINLIPIDKTPAEVELGNRVKTLTKKVRLRTKLMKIFIAAFILTLGAAVYFFIN